MTPSRAIASIVALASLFTAGSTGAEPLNSGLGYLPHGVGAARSGHGRNHRKLTGTHSPAARTAVAAAGAIGYQSAIRPGRCRVQTAIHGDQ